MDDAAKLGIALVVIAGLVLVACAVAGVFDKEYTVVENYNYSVIYDDTPILSALSDLNTRVSSVERKPDRIENVYMIEGTAACVVSHDDATNVTSFTCKDGVLS